MKFFRLLSLSTAVVFCFLAASSCAPFYVREEEYLKLDSKSCYSEFPQTAVDASSISRQKIKNIKDSYLLSGGLEDFKKLDIVDRVSIKGSKMEVFFDAKKMSDSSAEPGNIEAILWENALFLLYTIADTFPEVQKVRLVSEYYYKDQHGEPYTEVIFIGNVSVKDIKQVNRDHFHQDMLKNLVDHYMPERVMNKETEN
ncbi:MAG: hypothetical protein HPY66_2796 [Firmicutes bacterium]|nr:hypothetical protein [Bacillota bacterium]